MDFAEVQKQIKDGTLIKPHGTLVGVESSAISVVSYVSRRLKRAGWSRQVVSAVREEMLSDTYEHVLNVGMDMLEAPNDAD